MSDMVRKQIYIYRRQEVLLKKLAKARQLSEAYIIREAIDRETLGTTNSMIPQESSALQELIDFALSRRNLGETGEPYQWRREDAYEERMQRWDKRKSDNKES
jgi:hypothetical protein